MLNSCSVNNYLFYLILNASESNLKMELGWLNLFAWLSYEDTLVEFLSAILRQFNIYIWILPMWVILWIFVIGTLGLYNWYIVISTKTPRWYFQNHVFCHKTVETFLSPFKQVATTHRLRSMTESTEPFTAYTWRLTFYLCTCQCSRWLTLWVRSASPS